MTDMHTAASAPGPADHEASGQAPRDGSGSAGGDTPNAPGGPETRPSARKRRLVLWQPEVWIPLALLAVFLVLWALVLARPTFLTSFDLWLRDHVQDAAHADRDGAHRWRLIKGVADLGGGVAVPGVSVHVQLPTVALGAVALIAAAARRSWRPLAAAALGYAALGLVLFLKAVGDRPGPSMAGQALTG
ncbi:MAG: hypothetical protein HOV83_28750, partial [Catenulispora sp.]|nr:hypothetical protein [Catenulispora sp.]